MKSGIFIVVNMPYNKRNNRKVVDRVCLKINEFNNNV